MRGSGVSPATNTNATMSSTPRTRPKIEPRKRSTKPRPAARTAFDNGHATSAPSSSAATRISVNASTYLMAGWPKTSGSIGPTIGVKTIAHTRPATQATSATSSRITPRKKAKSVDSPTMHTAIQSNVVMNGSRRLAARRPPFGDAI
jgi:hypothetical protein